MIEFLGLRYRSGWMSIRPSVIFYMINIVEELMPTKIFDYVRGATVCGVVIIIDLFMCFFRPSAVPCFSVCVSPIPESYMQVLRGQVSCDIVYLCL